MAQYWYPSKKYHFIRLLRELGEEIGPTMVAIAQVQSSLCRKSYWMRMRRHKRQYGRIEE